MKKNLLGWLAMATMLVGTGCSSDEVVNDYSPENAIQFGTYVGRDAESRVLVTDIDVLKSSSEGFGVFANYTTNNVALNPNFMNNTQVTWNASKWEYSPLKYWPNKATDKVTFWAYWPWDTDNTAPTATAPFFAISDGTDHVASNPVSYQKSNIDNVTDKVSLTFNHMMSKVGFKVEAIVDETENKTTNNGDIDENTDATTNDIATVTKIVVTQVILSSENLVTSGKYTYGNIPDSNPVSQGWNLSSDAADEKTHTLTSVQLKTTTDVPYETNGTTTSTITGQVVTNASEQLNDDDEYLMLVPQTALIDITVHYSVITEDDNLDGGYSKVDNVISSGKFSFEFVRGNAYNFVLHLGMRSVKFDATVNNWDETNSDRVVHVPLNNE